ncbi:RNA-binding protein 34 [Balamuthia mandrillaris]
MEVDFKVGDITAALRAAANQRSTAVTEPSTPAAIVGNNNNNTKTPSKKKQKKKKREASPSNQALGGEEEEEGKAEGKERKSVAANGRGGEEGTAVNPELLALFASGPAAAPSAPKPAFRWPEPKRHSSSSDGEEEEDDSENESRKRKRKQTSKTQQQKKKSKKLRSGEDEEDEEDEAKGEDLFSPARLERTAFFGNVPLALIHNKAKGLRQLLKGFAEQLGGPVESVRCRSVPFDNQKLPRKASFIQESFHPKRDTCNAYVVFKEKESVAKAVALLHNHEVEGKHLRVDYATPPVAAAAAAGGTAAAAAARNMFDNKLSVFVGNLPFDMEEEALRQHFADCGEIENVRLIRDKDTNLGKGFGYILFASKASVSLALALHNSKFQGREIRVFRALAHPEKHKQKKQANGASRGGGRGRGRGGVRGGGRGGRGGRGGAKPSFQGREAQKGLKPRLKKKSKSRGH